MEIPQLPLRVVLSVSCVVARGALNGSVLKKLDALTKGLIDVTAIVLCTLIQVLAARLFLPVSLAVRPKGDRPM